MSLSPGEVSDGGAVKQKEGVAGAGGAWEVCKCRGRLGEQVCGVASGVGKHGRLIIAFFRCFSPPPVQAESAPGRANYFRSGNASAEAGGGWH